jgi:hypothetical protein
MNQGQNITANEELVACCGLYCGACGKYLKGKCPGCAKNEKAAWCKTRSCCLEKGHKSCADCATFTNPKQCKKFHNVVSKAFALIFGSNRPGSIEFIKEKGYAAYAQEMADRKQMSVKSK